MRFSWIVLGLFLWWTQTAAHAACTGDCSGDGSVTVDEVVLGVNIALGAAAVGGCSAMDSDGNGVVTVDEIITAIDGALTGCPAVEPTPTATATQPVAVETPTPCAENDGTASLRATSASPASGQGNLRITCVKAENAGGTRTELTRVTASGTILGVPMEFLVYFVTDTGAIDTVTYSWQPSSELPGAFDHYAYCNGPACAGASMHLGQLKIDLVNVPLANDFGDSATILGSITLNSLPNPMPTPTPACSGGSLAMSLTDVTGVNTSSPLPATLLLGSAMNFTTTQPPPAIATFSGMFDGCPSMFPRQTLSFSFSGFEIAAGTTYNVGFVGSFINQIEFSEAGFSSSKSWEAGSGTLTIDSVDAAGAHFRIIDAKMRPKGLGPTGTFTLNANGVLAVQ